MVIKRSFADKGRMENASTLGQRIAALRERRGWTQRKLAEESSLSATFISEVEGDKRKRVGYGSLLQISEALGASLDYLATGDRAPVAIREPLILPPDLVDAADEHGWSVDRTRTLLRARELVVAKRTRMETNRSPNRAWSKADWVRFHERLFEQDDATGS